MTEKEKEMRKLAEAYKKFRLAWWQLNHQFFNLEEVDEELPQDFIDMIYEISDVDCPLESTDRKKIRKYEFEDVLEDYIEA